MCANIRKLGNVGDIVQVAPGYHRNYLEPQGKAFFATSEKIEEVRLKSEALKAEDEARKVLALQYAEQLQSVELTFSKESNEAGVMFGSVTALDVCQLLGDQFTQEDLKFSKSAILMDKPLKTFGVHEVSVELHPHVVVDIKITITPKLLHH
ncbi:50S ribosomal protein L9 [Holospora obtusa F1]|uniref:Large ribosomal subunit protein bL9 n=1 Tax=Holospora obtusa F1 TaxID=1399147 RepID=W6TD21_HOLOB|nr:50S ribosomal protein L9 [Holospora obtusa]ETZ06773.1 50S ribosomal protein L9 [Holospora obtusa F1]